MNFAKHKLDNQIQYKSTRKTGANVLNILGHFQKCLTIKHINIKKKL
jgi:hypothetical protein